MPVSSGLKPDDTVLMPEYTVSMRFDNGLVPEIPGLITPNTG